MSGGVKLADRVQQQTTTTGTGTVTLINSVTGMQSFLVGVGSGEACYYTIVGGSQWETGIGTFTAAGSDTLTRDHVLDSSTGGSQISFSSGTKEVFASAAAHGLGGNVGGKIKVITASNYTIQLEDNGNTIMFECQAVARTCTFPLYSTLPEGFEVTIAKTDENSGVGLGWVIFSFPGTDLVPFQSGGAAILTRAGDTATLKLRHNPLLPSGANGIWHVINNGAVAHPEVGRAELNGSDTANAGAFTFVDLDTVKFGRITSDGRNMYFSTSISTLHLEDPVKVQIFAAVEVSGLNAGAYIYLRLNGAETIYGSRVYCHSNGGTVTAVIAAIVNANTFSDTVTLSVYNSDSAGRAMNAAAGHTYMCWNGLKDNFAQ